MLPPCLGKAHSTLAIDAFSLWQNGLGHANMLAAMLTFGMLPAI